MRTVTNSELSCFRRCPREWQHRYIDRVEPVVPVEALVRGKRAHAGIDAWWMGLGLSEMLDAAGPRQLSPSDAAMLRGYSARYQGPHLTNVRVNVPFAVDLGGVRLVGELDVLGLDTDGKQVIVEHKTTTSDIGPGSLYWRRVIHTDTQVSTYLRAFPRATVTYDVLRKPALRQNTAKETDQQFEARCLEAMAEAPERYFQRATVVRLEEEHRAFVKDVKQWAIYTQEDEDQPRNPDACFHWGRPCDFFSVCFEGRSLEAPEFRKVEKNHTEQIEEKLR